MSVIHTVHVAVRLAAVATLVTFSGAKADVGLQGVARANSKIAGLAVPNVLSPELTEVVVAQGSTPLENGTTDFLFYGYNGDGPMLPAPGDVQTSTHNVEATKTEPDKNTYLVLAGQDGPDPQYHYGTHFLFQGHESGLGTPKKGYITRINLDADAAHRVTLLASTDVDGKSLPVFDGSTWNPLDSAYILDLQVDYSDPTAPPLLRLLAQGRDASATIDSGLGSVTGNGFQNDGDNEITGIHISDGDPTMRGILGAKQPCPFHAGWRVFYTQQHGDNVTYEILPTDQ